MRSRSGIVIEGPYAGQTFVLEYVPWVFCPPGWVHVELRDDAGNWEYRDVRKRCLSFDDDIAQDVA